MSNFYDVSDDILGNILSRLPAKSFAAAACVNHSWNKISDLILSQPRFASGLSLAVTPRIAVNEALGMALSKPIRPHFAIAFVGLRFPIQEIHDRIKSKIGANTILITSASFGIIGVDSITKKLEEMKWEYDEVGVVDNMHRGISIIIGFVPGLKINVIPLLHTNSEPQVAMVDKFLSDVREFTVSVSGNTNPDPVGIMLFGDRCRNLKPILAVIDTKISRETVMIGDVHNKFVCTHDAIHNIDTTRYSLDAITLVFARDNQNSEVEIKFHVGTSCGILPIGSKLEIMDVLEYEGKFSGLVTRTIGEFVMPINASSLLPFFPTLIDDKNYFLYVGVDKTIVPQDGSTPIRYQEFYEIVGAYENMFIVAGMGINRGDTGKFYHSDTENAVNWSDHVHDRFNALAETPPRRVFGEPVWTEQMFKEKVFGGMVFASSNRGKKFFGESMTDCLPFCENFPGVPFGGTFCFQPIGRSPVLEEDEQKCEEDRFNMQVFNTVHLVMTYMNKS